MPDVIAKPTGAGSDVREALRHEPARRLLGLFIFKAGRAVAPGAQDEHESGRRDLAREMLAHIRLYDPIGAANLYLEWTGSRLPKDAVPEDAGE